MLTLSSSLSFCFCIFEIINKYTEERQIEKQREEEREAERQTYKPRLQESRETIESTYISD